MRHTSRARAVALGAVAGVSLTGCAWNGWGGTAGGEGSDSITVLMVNNPQMIDLQQLTDEHFTAETGIEVSYTVLPENDVRDKIGQEFSSQAGQYDVASLSNFEIPIYAGAGWVEPLDDYIAADADFDQADILPPMQTSLSYNDQVYGQPFYGESSFLMYRKDVLEAQGLTMPESPTWPEVAELAEQLDGAEPGMAGICLRGQPGWGQVIAPLTTVVNTFGGTWFTQDWSAEVNAPEFTEATSFYVDLVREFGPSGAAQAGYTECLNNLTQGTVAMWYDSTAAAGTLEADGSPVQGLIGYAPAPVLKTDSSGWLYAWSWAIQASSDNKDGAWEFISWASSKEYEELVGAEIGWASVPAGKRESTYSNEQYLEVASAFGDPTLSAISNADPANPGVQPRPALGIQFVGIPEFPDLGTQVSQDVSSAVAGRMTVEEVLDRGQDLAEDVAERYIAREGS